MKELSTRTCKMEWGLVGSATKVCRQRFEVESKDAGATKPHFNGFQYREYRFTQADVGRTIEVMSDDSGWRCWGFIL